MKSKFQVAEPVSAYDAKTHLPNLIARAEKGERFIITRHGQPVAQLIPIDPENSELMESSLAAVAKLRKRLNAKGITLENITKSVTSDHKMTIKEMAHDGHRY
jgi:prevent-host-death family protein